MYSVYAMNSKIVFLAHVLLFGGRLRLELFCIPVNMVCLILMLKKTRTDAWKNWPSSVKNELLSHIQGTMVTSYHGHMFSLENT